MKKTLLFLCLLIIGFFVPKVKAQENGLVLGVEQEIVTKKSLISSPNFRFGESVYIGDDLTGDVYAAGGEVRIDGSIDGDLLVAGGQVTINGDVTQDLRVLAGSVIINGQVEKNVTIFGGEVSFGPNSLVKGSLVGGAGNTDLSGSILGGTWFGTGQAVLGSEHGDQVNLWAGSVKLLKNAQIEGDLNLQVAQEDSFDDQKGVVKGNKNVKVATTKEERQKFELETKRAAKSFGVAKEFIGLLMAALTGSVILYLFPKLSAKLSASISQDLLAMVGWGLIGLFIFPLIGILLVVTIIGIPLAGITLLLYLLALMIGRYFTQLALGKYLFDKYQWGIADSSQKQFLVGLVLVSLVGLVPILGPIVKFVVSIIGLGSLVVWMKTELGVRHAK